MRLNWQSWATIFVGWPTGFDPVPIDRVQPTVSFNLDGLHPALVTVVPGCIARTTAWVTRLLLCLSAAGLLHARADEGDTNAISATNPPAVEVALTNGAAAEATTTNAPSVEPPPTNAPIVAPTETNAPAAPNAATNASPISPLATNALSSFRLRPGIRLEVVAAAPLLESPVAMAFDEHGRLFIVEMPGFTGAPDAPAGPGRIRLLQDTNEDGVFDQSSIYAEGLSRPSAIACYAGGVFVMAAPDLIYLRDSKGDGLVDTRKVVMSGFGSTNAPTENALINHFTWGLDDRIHAAAAGIGGVITSSNGAASVPVTLIGQDFNFDPRSLALQPESGSGQSGLSFDSFGRKYFCDNLRPLRRVMYESRYAARNPYFPRATQVIDIIPPPAQVLGVPAADRRVLPASAQGTAGSTNSLATRWLTRARSCLIYRGNLFPNEYQDNAFIADPAAHVIHRVLLRSSGLHILAEKPPEEFASEFLASRDGAFRPSDLLTGPDGALYVADLGEGGSRARILRLAPAGLKPPKLPDLGKASTRELVVALVHANGWRRDTAARLLYERQDPEARPLLESMLNNSQLPLGRFCALRSLAGLGWLKEAHLVRALRDPNEPLRVAALKLSERISTNGVVSETMRAALVSTASDPAPAVRYQLALTLGELQHPDKAVLLGQILRQDLLDPWVQTAVLSACADGSANLLVGLAGDTRFRSNAAGLEFLRQLAVMIGLRGQLPEVTQTLDFINRSKLEPMPTFVLLGALGDGLYRSRSSLALLDTQQLLKRFFIQALNVAIDDTAAEALRVEALRLVAAAPFTFADVGEWLLSLCAGNKPAAVQTAALAALAHFIDPRLGPEMLARWPQWSPAVRRQAATALLSRRERATFVMNALANGKISAVDVLLPNVNALRSDPDPATAQMAAKLFGPVPRLRPDSVKYFQPALAIDGVPANGRRIFQARCAACHQLGGAGTAFGPPLATAKFGGKAKLLESILEPHRAVNASYTTCKVESVRGDFILGLKEDETDYTVTLREPSGSRLVWPRLDLLSAQDQTWSLMPEGLEQGLSLQEMADLLAFVVWSN